MNKYIRFFNKKGEYCNFEYNESEDKWYGRIDMYTISKDLIENFQLYVLEEVYDETLLDIKFNYPLSLSENDNIKCEFDINKNVPEIFLYTVDNTILNKYYSLEYNLEYNENITILDNGMKSISDINTNTIQINIAFQPKEETEYSSILYIKRNDIIIAEILFYGEGEEEDERLKGLLYNLGIDLLPEDVKIFPQTDVKENFIDWSFLNIKRKELLLTYEKIFPYLGSYKALINIIKYFGYRNLRMKEYWKNVDLSSSNFGKYKHIELTDIFTENANFNTSTLIPSKVYKKTSLFGLYYDITTDSGEFDNDGLPIVKEVFSFSPEEILIKIYALKNKLKSYFLPLNARIIDIVGESVFYAKYDINLWNDQQRIDKIDFGIKPKLEVYPSNNVKIEDVRYLTYFGAPIGKDLTLDGYSDLLSWRLGYGAYINTGKIVHNIHYFITTFQIPLNSEPIEIKTTIQTDSNTNKRVYLKNEIADLIIKDLRNNSYINTNFIIYQENNIDGIIRVVQKNAIGDGNIYINWYTNTSSIIEGGGLYLPTPTSEPIDVLWDDITYNGGTALSIDISPNGTFGEHGAPLSYYSKAFLGYFNNININDLPDAENISVGAPIILKNITFDLTWDDMDVTYNQLDVKNPFKNEKLYEYYNYSTDTDFPTDIDIKNIYSWYNIGFAGYTEMQWIVKKEADETPSYFFDSGVDLIEKIIEYPLILPYVGKYDVILNIWDSYNNKSTFTYNNCINVELKENDFIGWYSLRQDINWNSKRVAPQTDYNNISLDDDITWDEMNSTWDDLYFPNEDLDMCDISFESLNSINFYQNISNPSTNRLIDKSPYRFDLIGTEVAWNDLTHINWDDISGTLTQFEFSNINSDTVILFMTKKNNNINHNNKFILLESDINEEDFEIGDYIMDIDEVFQWNGLKLVKTKEKIDFIKISIPSTLLTEKEKILYILKTIYDELYTINNAHTFLNEFIYYYQEELTDIGTSYKISAVSKDYDIEQRHTIKFSGINEDKIIKTYETVNYNYTGDIPKEFNIYKVNSGSGIKITGMENYYMFQNTDLNLLCNELNNTNNDILKKYNYNIVKNNGTYVKIQATSKVYDEIDEINIDFTGEVIGTRFGRSLMKNYNWDNLRILKYNQELPLLTLVNFSYDNSKINGKKNPVWELIKENDNNFANIYYNNKYFSYLFTERGSYSISLLIEDTNKNKKYILKKEIIKII